MRPADWMIRLGGGVGGFGLLCCFTPLLPWMLAAIGLGGLTSVLYRDSVLLPVAVGGLLLVGVGLWRKHRS